MLFGAYLKGAKRIEIVDPYIRLFHQARNLMEFVETVLKVRSPEVEMEIALRTVEDKASVTQRNYLEQIQEACATEGITFTYSFEDGIHDRSITTDTGWFIALGRGLDIFQQCDLNNAFRFTTRIQASRSCKPFTVTYVRK